jgi:hypothetical protein
VGVPKRDRHKFKRAQCLRLDGFSVRARPGRLSGLRVSHSESFFLRGAFVWARRALNHRKRQSKNDKNGFKYVLGSDQYGDGIADIQGWRMALAPGGEAPIEADATERVSADVDEVRPSWHVGSETACKIRRCVCKVFKSVATGRARQRGRDASAAGPAAQPRRRPRGGAAPRRAGGGASRP